MAFVRIDRPPVDAATYDAVTAALGLDDGAPEGLVLHTAGAVDGQFQIIDVWETLEHAEAFERDRLGPAIRQVLGDPPGPPPAPTTYELHNLYQP